MMTRPSSSPPVANIASSGLLRIATSYQDCIPVENRFWLSPGARWLPGMPGGCGGSTLPSET
jgi:hypothetical protein